MEPDESPLRIAMARVITRATDGSEITLGVAKLGPHETSRSWSFEEEDHQRANETFQGPHHETYYIIKGALTLRWTEGSLDLKEGDAVYLAPGWSYQLENREEVEAMFVYNVYPSAK
jgi:mannose-6-phosphate isomerase-like protein (cupin superfamily)